MLDHIAHLFTGAVAHDTSVVARLLTEGTPRPRVQVQRRRQLLLCLRAVCVMLHEAGQQCNGGSQEGLPWARQVLFVRMCICAHLFSLTPFEAVCAADLCDRLVVVLCQHAKQRNGAAGRRRAGGQMSSSTVGASAAPAPAARCTRTHTWRPTSTAFRSSVRATVGTMRVVHPPRHAVLVGSMVTLTPRSPFECRQAADSGARDAAAAGRCQAGAC